MPAEARRVCRRITALKDGVQVVPRPAEVFDPRLVPTLGDRARHVNETAFIDNPAAIGYEPNLWLIDVDASDGKESHPGRCGERLVRQSDPCGVVKRRLAEVEAEAEEGIGG